MRNWLYKKRKEKGLSQQEVADFIGRTPGLYSAIELGNRRPSPEVAQKLAKLFDFEWTKFYETKNNFNVKIKKNQLEEKQEQEKEE